MKRLKDTIYGLYLIVCTSIVLPATEKRRKKVEKLIADKYPNLQRKEPMTAIAKPEFDDENMNFLVNKLMRNLQIIFGRDKVYLGQGDPGVVEEIGVELSNGVYVNITIVEGGTVPKGQGT